MRTIGTTSVDGEVRAVASGTLPSGQPVVVNADGTVSVVAETSATQAIGSTVDMQSNRGDYVCATYDSNSNKVVVAFSGDANGNAGKAIVGTVSGTSISFGTLAQFYSGRINGIGITFDSANNKVVVSYADVGNSSYGTAAVGTVSGTDISFGTPVVYNSGATGKQQAAFDPSSGKVVIAYIDDGDSSDGTAIVGTVNGTGISFGSEVDFNTGSISNPTIVADTTNDKVVVSYKVGNFGKSRVGTVSGTSISFGTEATFVSAANYQKTSCFDSDTGKVFVAYRTDGGSNSAGVVGTVSGTDITFGTPVVFSTNSTAELYCCYNTAAKKVILTYEDATDSQKLKIVEGTISGTTVSFGSAIDSGSNSQISTPGIVYDSTQKVAVIAFRDSPSVGTDAFVFQSAYTSSNLTSENYIGLSSGSVVQNTLSQASGTPVQFEPDSVEYSSSAYDSNSNRVVVAYSDAGDSNKGKAVVVTVNAANNSVSFGTPVVFEAGYTRHIAATFDSNSNKIVIMCADGGNSNYGTAIVGTIDSSDNSISFGSAVVFEGAAVDEMSATFDSNANKVVIAYRDKGNSNRGTAIVGTVSGTSISFGTAVVFLSEDSRNNAISFDSTANKVVIAYADNSSTYRGTAIVGTVSGTGISFGSQVVFANASTSNIGCTYDSNSNKTVIAYADAQADGTAIVATVSGTSISFGTAVEFEGDSTTENKISFDSNVNKVVIMYRDSSNTTRPSMIVGSVSGTSISFETAITLTSSGSNYYTNVFDTTSKKVVFSYRDSTNTAGFAAVFQASGVITTRNQVASGSSAIIDSGCAISTNQLNLTAGQQYFVQTDGTLGLTAATPSVLAGTAVSATKLIVKG